MPTFPTPRDAYFGNPATPGHQPDKLDIVRILEQMQAIASTEMLVGFVDAIADLPSSGNTSGDKYAVMDVEPDGGIYNWTGTAWAKISGLPVTLTIDEFAVLARAWAQNPEDVPVVTGPDGFSALHWARKALAQAGIATTQAGLAAGYAADALAASGLARVPTTPTLLADDNVLFGYAGSGAALELSEGALIEAVSNGCVYSVAASTATDQHVTTAGGLKLYVQQVSAGGQNILAWGADASGAVDAQPILAAMNAAGVNRIIIPEDCSIFIGTQFVPTTPVEFVGASRATSKILCGVNNDYAVKVSGPGISTSKPIFRNLTIAAKAGATAPSGLSLFDNAAREWLDINIEGALTVAIEIIQGVLPSFRNIVAYGGQGTTIRLNHGSTATIVLVIDNCYFTGATSKAVEITGATRKVAINSTIFENNALGIDAAEAEITLKKSWFESNTKDFNCVNCFLDYDDTVSVNAANPSTVSYPALPPFQAFLALSGPLDRAIGGMHNADMRTPSTANTWESLLFGSSFPSPFINPNPGGSSFSDIQVKRSGLYEVDYSVTFVTASAVAGIGAVRIIKDPAGTPVEVAGSYGAVSIPATSGDLGTVSRKCIVELNADDILRVQFSSSDTQVRVGGSGAATPTATTNATVIVRSLGFTSDTTIS